MEPSWSCYETILCSYRSLKSQLVLVEISKLPELVQPNRLVHAVLLLNPFFQRWKGRIIKYDPTPVATLDPRSTVTILSRVQRAIETKPFVGSEFSPCHLQLIHFRPERRRRQIHLVQIRKRVPLLALHQAGPERDLQVDGGLNVLGLRVLMLDRLLEDACRGRANWLPQKLGANERGWAYAAVKLCGI